MSSKFLRALLAMWLALSLLIAIIILAVTLSRARDDEESDEESDVGCQFDMFPLQDSFGAVHSGCVNTALPLVKGCSNTTQQDWMVFERSTYGWSQALQFVPTSKNEEFSSIVVSPRYSVSSKSCSLQISLKFPLNSNVKLFIFLPKIDVTLLSPTQGPCHHYILDSANILSNLETFQIFLISNASPTTGRLEGSVTSQTCHNYMSIETEPQVTYKPNFHVVPRGRRNRCSSDIINGDVLCDWMIVDNLGSENFTREGYHKCLFAGATRRPEDSEVWYLRLNGTHAETTGYLISPIIEGGTSHLLLSFWYIAQCTATKLKVYIVPSFRDIGGVLKEILPVYEVNASNPSFQWVFQSLDIPIPSHYESYQVVLEGDLSKENNCTEHRCLGDGRRAVGEPEHSMLAIDEMTLETRFDRCNISDNANSSILDCTFEGENDLPTHCLWRPSTIPGAPEEDCSIFAFWTCTNTPTGNDRGTSGATASHLEGRGYVLTFQAFSTGNGNHIRTPVLIANSSCSCGMSFLFLVRGSFSPRLQVNILLGDDPGVDDVADDDRPVLPQWSVFGHQGENWTVADILLNLPAMEPFQVEIRARDLTTLRGEMNLDDIFFRGCDFSFYS